MMKAMTYTTILFLTVYSVSAKGSPTITGKGDWGTESAGLVCRITTDKDQYVIGDQVHILVEVSNRTDSAIALGLEPLIDMRNGDLSRQPAEIHTHFTQEENGQLGYFCTGVAPFPTGTKTEAKAVVVEGGKTYSAMIPRTPWGPSYGCSPSEAQPGLMKLSITIFQYPSGDLKRMEFKSPQSEFTVKKKTENANQVPEDTARKLADPQH
jgi:hypothetical protein